MMISKAMNTKLNEQITHEFGASSTYLAMACTFAAMELPVLAGMFRKQTEEERGHALKILDYIISVGGTVKLEELPAPRASYPSVLAAVEAALAHERKVTAQINDLARLAEKEQDFATRGFLQWYVDEQVEEVNSMIALVSAAKQAGSDLMKLEMYLAMGVKKG